MIEDFYFEDTATATERLTTNFTTALQKAAISTTANTLSTSIVKGENLTDIIKNQGADTLLQNVILSALAETGAKEIGYQYHGGEIDKATQLTLHGALGYTTATLTGQDSAGRLASAAGAIAGEVVAESYFNNQLDKNGIEITTDQNGRETILLNASDQATLNQQYGVLNQIKSQAVELSKIAGAFAAVPFAGSDNASAIYAGSGAAGNAASNNALNVRAQEVGLGFKHLTIVHTPEPEEQASYANKDGYVKDKETGLWIRTWGAGGSYGIAGDLISDNNRPRDRDLSIKNYTSPNLVPVEQESYYVQLLNKVDSNYQDSLSYRLFPSQNNDHYNSNSYVSGLLIAADIVPPSIPDKNIKYQWQGWEYDNSPAVNVNYTLPFQVPGYDKPVPSQYFRSNE
jgi:hypothetical protein